MKLPGRVGEVIRTNRHLELKYLSNRAGGNIWGRMLGVASSRRQRVWCVRMFSSL